nr:MAG TPA: hypothetical protein [Caudoviricetes sp.]
MSINSMRKTYEVWENKQTEDKWGATINEEVKVGTAEITINYSSATNMQNDVRYAEVTHFGLTSNKTLKQNQILVLDNERYVIHLPPNNVSRYTQLYLKAVE